MRDGSNEKRWVLGSMTISVVSEEDCSGICKLLKEDIGFTGAFWRIWGIRAKISKISRMRKGGRVCEEEV